MTRQLNNKPFVISTTFYLYGMELRLQVTRTREQIARRFIQTEGGEREGRQCLSMDNSKLP